MLNMRLAILTIEWSTLLGYLLKHIDIVEQHHETHDVDKQQVQSTE